MMMVAMVSEAAAVFDDDLAVADGYDDTVAVDTANDMVMSNIDDDDDDDDDNSSGC